MPTKCSVSHCNREDAYSDQNGRCIFHYDKHDWYKTTTTGCRDWSHSMEHVAEFWKAIREQIAAKSYSFVGYVFPLFWPLTFNEDHDGSQKSVFDSDVQCVGATFLSSAKFNDMHFKSLARFDGSIFEEGAEFQFTWFAHEASFSDCKFLGETSFRSIFYDKVHFNQSTFSQEKRTSFGPLSLGKEYSVFRNTTYFRNVDFPHTFSFNHIDFTHVSFSGSNVENAEFSECTFETIDGRIRLFDEKGIYKDGGYNVISATYFGIMENLYRQFKRNFENKRDWRRLGEFFIAEMEMRRTRLQLEANGRGVPREEYLLKLPRFPSLHWWQYLQKYPPRIDTLAWWKRALERFFLTAFRSISFYGEREGRALVSILCLVIIGAIALRFFGDAPSFVRSFLLSLRAVSFQQESRYEELSYLSQWIMTILRVGSAVLLPLFALALRNRFKR